MIILYTKGFEVLILSGDMDFEQTTIMLIGVVLSRLLLLMGVACFLEFNLDVELLTEGWRFIAADGHFGPQAVSSPFNFPRCRAGITFDNFGIFCLCSGLSIQAPSGTQHNIFITGL